MSLVPFNRQDRLAYKPMTNMLDDFFGDVWRPIRNLTSEAFKVDVREEILHYIVEAEMPGVQKEDVSIEFREGCLIITVHREEKADEKDTEYVHRERCCTSVRRSIYLADAKGTGITAAMSDGVLHINVPKEESVKSAKIEIK